MYKVCNNLFPPNVIVFGTEKVKKKSDRDSWVEFNESFGGSG
jgi:hypothetical protein